MTVATTIIHYTSPGFVVSIVAGILYGIAAIALFDKALRRGFFLPYFYMGIGGLFYAVAEAFQVVWARYFEERSRFALDASVLATTFGTCFILLALFRLLQVWYTTGRNTVLSTRRTWLVICMMILLTGSVTFAGDVILVELDERSPEEVDPRLFAVGYRLKAAGSVLAAILATVYLSLALMLTLQRSHKTKTGNRSLDKSLALVLSLMGVMVFIRLVFYSFLVFTSEEVLTTVDDDDSLKQSNVWPYLLGMIQVPSIILFAAAALFDLTRVKSGTDPSARRGYVGIESGVEST